MDKAIAGKWLGRIKTRRKVFENGWWKQADAAEKMYDPKEGTERQRDPFPILYANTEVLLPALYSASPRPDVIARTKKANPVIMQATEAFLKTIIDMNVPGRESFDESVGFAVLSGLIPGAGFVRLRVYKGETCPIRAEAGSYKEIIWGKAKKWSQVPWLAFVHTKTKEEITKQFELTPEQARMLKVETQEEADQSQKKQDDPLYVYELWLKEDKKVVWLCEGYADLVLDEDDDVYKLEGFYPVPKLMQFVQKTSTLDPTPLYEYYRNQAEELNRVTVRLNKVLDAIRVRGAYNPLLGEDLKNLLGEGSKENGLVAATMAMDLQGKGFEAHIWFLPIEKLIEVARELYAARMQILGVIQQITGLSDIVRGQTAASETATAQDLKNRWGTIRLKRLQKIVAFYVRDLLRMAVALGANALGPEEWAQMTQMDLPTPEQKQQAVMQLQAMSQQQVPGQPPPQPPPALMNVVQSPTWTDVLGVLASDQGRVYTIDIETDSTIDVDAAQDKQEVTEFVVALGQFISAVTPLVEMGPTGVEVAKEILIEASGKFKFGREVQEALKKLQAPDQSKGDPKAAAEAQKIQIETQALQQKLAMEKQAADAQAQAQVSQLQTKDQLDKMKAQADMAKLQREEALAVKQFELAMSQADAEKQKLLMSVEASKIKLEVAKKLAADRKATPAANSRPTK